jgi:hypothetical protein
MQAQEHTEHNKLEQCGGKVQHRVMNGLSSGSGWTSYINHTEDAEDDRIWRGQWWSFVSKGEAPIRRSDSEPVQTTGDRQQKEVQRSGSWRGKDKIIHFLVFSSHGSKLFLLLSLHFHTRTFISDLMPVANQCKSNRISFHPWEATYDFFSSHHACVDSGCWRCVWRPFGSCAQSFCAPSDSSLAYRTCVKPPSFPHSMKLPKVDSMVS